MDTVQGQIRGWPGREDPVTLTTSVHETNTSSIRVTSASDHQHSELLRRVATQDAEAFSELYDCLAGPLYSIAVYMLGNTREAEEVIQDVFVQIWNSAGAFDGNLGTPAQWTSRMTRNRCIDYMRSRQRRARLEDEVTTETEILSLPEVSSARQSLIMDEIAQVRACVRALPEDQRQVIEMAFFQGLTHAEIANSLGEPLGTVKARIRRGMMKLKEILKVYI